MELLKKQWVNILVLVIVSCMLILRLTSYGELGLSVANGDTDSYIQGGEAPFFSKNMFTKNRLFTTNLLYYLADVQECEIQALSFPAIQKETYRAVQPCFDRIVLFQNITSAIAWSLLALLISKRLHGGYEKILAAVLITAFGFSPTIADWDSLLSSESLSFSLFAICLALVVEVGFRMADRDRFSKRSIFIYAFSIIAIGFWTFTRDSNVYAVAVLLAMSISLLIYPPIRKNKLFLVYITLIIIFAAVGFKSASVSRRWEAPLRNVFTDLIIPYPARLAFMEKYGMPAPESPEYSIWFLENAQYAYGQFLLFHPGYTLTSFTASLDGIFSENIQPYFYSEQTPLRNALIAVNDFMHPKTLFILFIDILIAVGFLFSIQRTKNRNLTVWYWIGIWLFLSALMTLAVGFFADSIGVARHTMFAIEVFRLLLWLFIIILLDQVNHINTE